MTTLTIREVDPGAEVEIQLVARRMRETLVEVLGKERGEAIYPMGWLIERVRWHLDPACTTGKVIVCEGPGAGVIGQAIARIDRDEAGVSFGYFSTIFVVPEARRQGVASRLINHVERWFIEMKMPRIVYNTARDHARLIRLFEKHGFRMSLEHSDMVQLTKPL